MKTTALLSLACRGLAVAAATALGAGVLSAAAPVVRDDDATPAAPVVRDRDDRPVTTLKHGDRNFLERAARQGSEEVQISRVAAERTVSPEVKHFAETIIADHADFEHELAALASGRGVNLPARETADRWMKRDAKNFDRDYIDKMVSDHEDTVKLFEKQAKDGNDAESVAFARKYLPKLQRHLQEASDLQRMLKNRR